MSSWDQSPAVPPDHNQGYTYTPADFPYGGFPGYLPAAPELRIDAPAASGGPVNLVGASPASMGNRLLAKIIDGLIVTLPFAILYLWAENAHNTGAENAISLAALASTFVYETLYISFRGTTIGKRARGIQVLSEATGQRLTPAKALQRSFVQWITTYLLLAGWWSPFLDRPTLRGWHDKAAGDVVVVGSRPAIG